MIPDIDAIKARLAAATPGPWEATTLYDGEGHWADRDEWWPSGPKVTGYEGEMSRADAEFIAHARQDIPALIAEIERLRDEK